MIPLLSGLNREEEPSEPLPHQDYWLSYSDLLAGLLLVFTLLLLTALYNYQSGVEGVREILRVRQEVIENLQAEFQTGETRLVEVQPDGTVRFAENVLFLQDSATLTAEGQSQLSAFGMQYVNILFGKAEFGAFRDQLAAIVVEGHTNDDGSYIYNLGLSQRRASAVLGVLLQSAGPYEEALQRYATANGRSYSELVCVDGTVDSVDSIDEGRRCASQGGVDKIASRRIEIRFQLRDGVLLQDLLDLLNRQ